MDLTSIATDEEVTEAKGGCLTEEEIRITDRADALTVPAGGGGPRCRPLPIAGGSLGREGDGVVPLPWQILVPAEEPGRQGKPKPRENVLEAEFSIMIPCFLCLSSCAFPPQ